MQGFFNTLLWIQTNDVSKTVLTEGYLNYRLSSFSQWLDKVWLEPYCNVNSFLYYIVGVTIIYLIGWKVYNNAEQKNETSIFAEWLVSPYARILNHIISVMYLLGVMHTALYTKTHEMPKNLDTWLFPLQDWVSINLGVGLDGVSIAFGILTWYIFTICEKWIRNKPIKQQYELMIAFLLSQFSIYLCFFTTDVMLFFVGFELASIPMFWMILRHGSRERKQRAAIYFLLYTLLSSIFLFIPIISLMINFGTTELYALVEAVSLNCSHTEQLIYAYCLFIGFGVKVPIVPLHYWLTEAHVEAPTVGSVLLAALVLKLGGYGMIKYLLFLFPKICLEYSIFVQNLALISAIYAAWVALRQDDVKRIIAYSSISHMNFSLVALFSMTVPGLLAGIGLMIGHGFVAAGLFSVVGALYDRIKTRLTIGLNGISKGMPKLTAIGTLLVLSNFGFPLTVNFVGEQIALMSLVQQSIKIMVLLSTSIILTVAFSLWFLNRTQFGTLQVQHKLGETPIRMIDLTHTEYRTLISICFIIIFLGIFPEIYLDLIRDDVNFMLNWMLRT